DWVTVPARRCPAGRRGGHFGLTRVHTDRPRAAVPVPIARRRPRMPPSDVPSSADEPASADRPPRMSSAGRAYRAEAAGCGCAAARLIRGRDFGAGWVADGLAPEPGAEEDELLLLLEPPPELLPWPPWEPPPPGWFPLCARTSWASFLVWARIE